MQITVLTMMYNEGQIAPFFLNHYKDFNIRVLLETDTDDRTENILMSYGNVTIIPCHIEGGIDDTQKVRLINKELNEIQADWVYVVDPDEFILPVSCETPQEFLKRQEGDVVGAWMYQVFRHKDDKDLDPTLPPIPQRLHGDPDRLSTSRTEHTCANALYVKPIVIRAGKGIQFEPGNHSIKGEFRICAERYHGVHWQMADPSIAIPRRMLRKKRISETNKQKGHGVQHWNVTETDIKEALKSHDNDPLLPILDNGVDLHFLKYLSFEINDECQLTNIHKGCPRNARKLIGKPLETSEIISFLHHCLRRDFRGMVNFHYYNEPLMSKKRMMEVMAAVPYANYSLWTNGFNLTAADAPLINLFSDVMVTIYPGVNIYNLNALSVACRNMRFQQGNLDNRILQIEGKEIKKCDRPNWELIVDYCGQGHVCCGDWKSEMYIGDIRDGHDRFLARWDLWRKQLLNKEFPEICKVCYARAPETSRL
jgi:hypothetical protein